MDQNGKWLEEAIARVESVTTREIEEIPLRTKEQLMALAIAAIISGISTNFLNLTALLAQAFVLGQRAAIDLPDWEEE